MDEVARGLWQGNAQDAMQCLRHHGVFDGLALCAEEVQPELGAGSRAPLVQVGELAVLRCPLRDQLQVTPSEWQRALRAARWVARSVQGDRRVLVTCAMGWNRSGLVSALALRALGTSPRTAVTLVRQARGSEALSNATFERLVHQVRREELRL